MKSSKKRCVRGARAKGRLRRRGASLLTRALSRLPSLSPPCFSDEPKEIKSLYRRFRRLDIKGRGTISVDDLTMIPEVHMNPLGLRVCAMFARDGEGRINFRSFALGLSVLSSRARAAVKSEALFKIYDVDNDGAISAEDIRVVLRMATGSALSAAALSAVVAQTLKAGDRDGDGVINVDDWRAMPYAWDTFSVPVRRQERDSYFASTQVS